MDILTPAVILLSASPGSGKSTAIRYFLWKLSKAGRFSHGLVFTNSIYDNEYGFLPEKAVSRYSEDKLKRFMRYQRDRVAEGAPVDAFLVLDDILGSANLMRPVVTMLFTEFRHFRITVFVSTQYLKRIPTTVRACASIALIYKPTDGNSLRAAWEVYGPSMRFEDFKQLVFSNTGDHNALYVDNRTSDAKRRFSKWKAPLTPEFAIEF